MQKAVFTLLATLAPVDLPQLWPDLIDLLLNLLKPNMVEGPSSAESRVAADATASSSGGGGSNVNKHAITSLSMEKTIEILAQLYR